MTIISLFLLIPFPNVIFFQDKNDDLEHQSFLFRIVICLLLQFFSIFFIAQKHVESGYVYMDEYLPFDIQCLE